MFSFCSDGKSTNYARFVVNSFVYELFKFLLFKDFLFFWEQLFVRC